MKNKSICWSPTQLEAPTPINEIKHILDKFCKILLGWKQKIIIFIRTYVVFNFFITLFFLFYYNKKLVISYSAHIFSSFFFTHLKSNICSLAHTYKLIPSKDIFDAHFDIHIDEDTIISHILLFHFWPLHLLDSLTHTRGLDDAN